MLPAPPLADDMGSRGREVTRLVGTSKINGGRRLPVLQALIVLAVAGLVAALAIPALAAQAKTSVLRQNQVELALQIRTHVVLCADATQAGGVTSSSGAGAAAAIASTLSGEQRSGQGGRFSNPFSGSSAIVYSSAPPAARATRPGVWVTDDARYAYAAFRPSQITRSQLAGSLVVVAVEDGDTVTFDVSYVDSHGRRSPHVETIVTPAAAWQE
jgi:hypothetical protein